MSVPQPKSPWYRDGLAFTCTQCGDCCTACAWLCLGHGRGDASDRRAPGGGPPDIRRAVRPAGRRSLQSDRETRGGLHLLGPCLGLHGLSRSARPVPRLAVLAREPLQRTSWERVCAVCPGAGQGRVHTLEEIRASWGWSRNDGSRRDHIHARRRGAVVFGELEALYSQLDEEVARACRLSDQRALLPVPRVRPHPVPLGSGMRLPVEPCPRALRPLDDGETCPWQDERGRCTAREARPLGCRVYFCDPAYEGAAPSSRRHSSSGSRGWSSGMGCPGIRTPPPPSDGAVRDDPLPRCRGIPARNDSEEGPTTAPGSAAAAAVPRVFSLTLIHATNTLSRSPPRPGRPRPRRSPS